MKRIKDKRKPIDEHEERVRSQAKYFTVVPMAGAASIGRFEYDDLDTAITAAKIIMIQVPGLRSCMLYAVDHNDRYVLEGSVETDREFKSARYEFKEDSK